MLVVMVLCFLKKQSAVKKYEKEHTHTLIMELFVLNKCVLFYELGCLHHCNPNIWITL